MEKAKQKSRVRLLFLIPIALFSISLFIVCVGNYWIKIIDKYNEKKELNKKLVQLQQKEEELNSEVDKLSSSEYIARYAREKYGYSKENEIIIQFNNDSKK